MQYLPSARACGQYNFASTKCPVFNWGCWLVQVVHNGPKMVVVVVVVVIVVVVEKKTVSLTRLVHIPLGYK